MIADRRAGSQLSFATGVSSFTARDRICQRKLKARERKVCPRRHSVISDSFVAVAPVVECIRDGSGTAPLEVLDGRPRLCISTRGETTADEER